MISEVQESTQLHEIVQISQQASQSDQQNVQIQNQQENDQLQKPAKNDLDNLVNELLSDTHKYLTKESSNQNTSSTQNQLEKFPEDKKTKVEKQKISSNVKGKAPPKTNYNKQMPKTVVSNKQSITQLLSARGPRTQKLYQTSPQLKEKRDQSIRKDSEEQVNIQISVKQKSIQEYLFKLQEVLNIIKTLKQDQKGYQDGLLIEFELNSLLTKGSQMPQYLITKVEQFLLQNEDIGFKKEERKVETQWESQDLIQPSPQRIDAKLYSQIASPQPKKKKVIQSDINPISPQSIQVKIPAIFQTLNIEKKKKLELLLMKYEQSVSQILAKDLQKLKNLNGKGSEIQLSQMFLYLFSALDDSILLTTDRKYLLSQQWEDCKKYLSNSGKVIFNLKKLRDYIDSEKITNIHFQQVLSLYDEIQQPALLLQDPNYKVFIQFLENAIDYIKFVKEQLGVPQEQLRTPMKSARRGLLSPERNSTNKQAQFSGVKKRMHSPEFFKTNSAMKSKAHQDIFHQETQNLVETAQTKQKLKSHEENLLSIQTQINKMKFDLEKEEKLALINKEKQDDQDYLEFQKLQMKINKELLKEKQRKEKEEFLQRQKELGEENHDIKQYKKAVEEQMIQDTFIKDFEREKQFKLELEQQMKEQQKALIQLNQENIKEKEAYEREKYIKEVEDGQKEREEERRKDIKKQMKELKNKEDSLQKEIALLMKVKEKPIKIPGTKQ